MLDINEYKTLFTYCGDDFEVWSDKQYTLDYFNMSIEGYIGLDELKDFVGLYQDFSDEFLKFLQENNYTKTEKHRWKCIYESRAIEVCHDHGCYWVFLEPYKSTEIWDLYYYIEDVIKQLKNIELDK